MSKHGKKAAPAAVEPVLNEPVWRQVLREPVALGLVPLILVRPFIDGATWPTDNFYFVWGILLLACVFLARMLMRGVELRFKAGTILLGLFWLAGLATMATTFQYSVTYRSVIIWAGHFFLFLAVVNGVRSRLAIRIVLAAMIVAFLAETVYSYIHFSYILPLMRRMVMADSYMLNTGVDGAADSAGLVHRLQTNRASGSLLFPNALAGFLVLAIPITFTEIVRALRELSRRKREPQPTPLQNGMTLTLAASLTWLAASCAAYFLVPLAAEGSPGYMALFVVFVIIVPVLVAAWVVVALQRGGWPLVGLWARVGVLPFLLAGEVVMLWRTYSRGGMLALVAAVALVWLLVALRRRGLRANVPAAAGMVLIAVMAAVSAADTATPADTAPSPQAAAASGQAPVQPEGLTSEGRGVSMRDLASGATFVLRISYWRTGLRMALDNLWTGVGWGNFGAIYPNYRPPDAGTVRMAHNDYLQVLCETGLLGFVFFCGFWAYVMWWGLRRVWAEQDRRERWALLGLFTGLVAFLGHSLIDFNFQNPSLVFFALLAAGLLVSRGLLRNEEAAPTGEPVKRRPVNQLLALPLLLAAAVVAGMAFRVYLSDFIEGRGEFLGVGDDKRLREVLHEGEFFFPPAELSGQNLAPRRIAYTHMAGLVPFRSVLEEAGAFLVPGSRPNTARKLRPDEEIPARAVFIVSDFEKAKQEALPFAKAWLDQLKDADSVFPYEASLSQELTKWYALLAQSLPPGEQRDQFVLDHLKWARESVRRSPREFQYRLDLANALWLRSSIEKDPAARKKLLNEALASFEDATELAPGSSEVLWTYGDGLRAYRKILRQSGAEEEAEQVRLKAGKLRQRAAELDAAQLRF